MRLRVSCVVVGLGFVVGCGGGDGSGDDEPAVDASVEPDADPCAVTVPTGMLSSPDELDTTVCDASDFDLDQVVDKLWYLESIMIGGPMRLTVDQCGRLGIGGDRYVEVFDDGVFIRVEQGVEPNLYTEAVFLCAEGAGTHPWVGTGRWCRPRLLEEGIECSDESVVLTPFGWNEGDVESDGMALVGEWNPENPFDPDTQVAGVRVRGGFAYLAERQGLRIVDVSNPAQPEEVSFFHVANEYINDIDVVDDGNSRFVLLAAGQGALVFDVTDVTEPKQVATIEFSPGITAGVHRMFTEVRPDGGARLYLIDGFSAAVSIWDVSNPAAPSQLGLYMDDVELGGYHDLFVADDVMYINDMYGDRFVVVNAADPFRPVELGFVGEDPRITFSHSAWVTEVDGRRVAAVGNEGFDTTIAIVDVDPDSEEFMTILGHWKLRPEVSAHHLVARGDRVYVTHYLDGLRVLDISDLANPTQDAFFNTWDRQVTLGGTFYGAYDLDLDDDFIYVADTSRGLLILRETDETPM